ncbi:MAG TPA: ABC transporter ATP-binding protein [Symbiobacteriaceae bacterium]|nr:ABC transporter ATP-binding protein [Symbiobacteriaceae bacterium]
MSTAILECQGVSRSFGGLVAVHNVDLAVRSGEIVGLIGPNGAGKTTLLNLISGVHPLSSGRILFGGHRLDGLSPDRITRQGIARTFQVVKPLKGLTVLENVAIGAMFGNQRQLSLHAARHKAEEVLRRTGLGHKAQASANALSIAERKRLEVARALAMEPKVILLDEVMAGLNQKEMEQVIDLVREVNGTYGVSMILIEHVLKAVMSVSHRVVVLHHGEKIAEGTPAAVVTDPSVIRAYLGDRYAKVAAEHAARGGA